MGKAEGEGSGRGGGMFKRSQSMKKVLSTPVLSSTEKIKEPLLGETTLSLPNTQICHQREPLLGEIPPSLSDSQIHQREPLLGEILPSPLDSQICHQGYGDSTNIHGRVKREQFCPDTNGTKCPTSINVSGPVKRELSCPGTNGTNFPNSINVSGKVKRGLSCPDTNGTNCPNINITVQVECVPLCRHTNETNCSYSTKITGTRSSSKKKDIKERLLAYASKVGPEAYMALDVPKYIIWEVGNKWHTIKRGSDGSFGFETRETRQHEYYVVVMTVDERGPAIGILKPCDRILNVNGFPLTDAKAINYFRHVYKHKNKIRIEVCSADSVKTRKLTSEDLSSIGSGHGSSYYSASSDPHSIRENRSVTGSSLGDFGSCSLSGCTAVDDCSTRVKHVLSSIQPCYTLPNRYDTKSVSKETYIHRLPTNIVSDISFHLTKENLYDWEYLAGCCGLSTEDVQRIKSVSPTCRRLDYAKHCLLYLGQSEQLTIGRLLDILENEMDRLDIIHDIKEKIVLE